MAAPLSLGDGANCKVTESMVFEISIGTLGGSGEPDDVVKKGDGVE